MKYKEITIYPAADAVEEAAERLAELGYEQLEIGDPKDAEALKEESWGYTGSFVDRQLIEELSKRAYIKLYLGEKESLPKALAEFLKAYDHSAAIVDDQDWLHKWEEYYVPFEIAPGIVVKPVWREYEAKEGELVVEIDPGLAFGTGSSPTTYLAARLLAELIKPGMEMLDVGCGTGILSVIGAKLGAKSVFACDMDPEAVLSTAKNADLNGCSNIKAIKNDLVKGLDHKYDIIAANLTGPLVVKLCENVAACCKEGSVLIASGIIDDMEETCAQAIKAAGFEVVKIVRDDCWSAIAAVFTGQSAWAAVAA